MRDIRSWLHTGARWFGQAASRTWCRWKPGANAAKPDSLASTEHVERWIARLSPNGATSEQVREIAETLGWESHPMRTLNVAGGAPVRHPTGL